jgi:hypothetical protein
VQPASATAESKRRALGEGAAEEAPTAPHATPRFDGAARTGPERFWARWPVRVAFGLCLVLSCMAHGSIVPLDMPHRLEVNDVEGDAVIPVDLLGPEQEPAAPLPPSPPPPSTADNEKEQTGPAPTSHDGPPRADAGLADAAADAPIDAPIDGPLDVSDAPAGPPERFDGAVAGVSASSDGGAKAARDPEALLASEAAREDRELVRLVVNAEVVRRHPVAARLGYLLRAIPQWDEFMSGTEFDPVRDADWVIVSGPSLVHTAHDLVLIHYSASDAAVDAAIRIIARKYDRGGPFDAGVRGLKATLFHADRGERVVFRPQPHLLVVVPPNRAETNARLLGGPPIDPHTHAGEAMFLRLVDPHHPVPEIPATITEMRMRIAPTADGGADVLVEGDTNDGDAASNAADELRRMVRRHNDGFTSLLTHGLLDHVVVGVEGSTVTVRLTATLDQIETIVTLAGDFLGAQVPPPSEPAPGGVRSPEPSPRLPFNPQRPR